MSSLLRSVFKRGLVILECFLQMLQDMRVSGYGASDLGDLGFIPTDPTLAKECLGGVQVMGAFVELSLSQVRAVITCNS